MKIFNTNWWLYDHTKWDSKRYDKAYFSPLGVHSDNGIVYLSIENAERLFKTNEIFPDIDGDKVKCFACGEMQGDFTTQTFSYGTYEWVVKVPKQANIWPAVWLCSAEGWTHEIDVFEGYTNKRGSYNNLLWTKLETNVHYFPTPNKHRSIGGRGIFRPLYNLYKNKNGFDKWKCVWTPDKIAIYFNGLLIRKITDKNVLAPFNKAPRMYPIMNMMVLEDFTEKDINGVSMIIKSFSYKEYKSK